MIFGYGSLSRLICLPFSFVLRSLMPPAIPPAPRKVRRARLRRAVSSGGYGGAVTRSAALAAAELWHSPFCGSRSGFFTTFHQASSIIFNTFPDFLACKRVSWLSKDSELLFHKFVFCLNQSDLFGCSLHTPG